MYTTLYTDSPLSSFEVQTEWLQQYVREQFHVTLGEFLRSYTCDNAQEIFLKASVDGVLRTGGVIRG